MVTQSDSIKNIAAAMAKVQASIEGAKKGSDNPHFKSKYADLTECWTACRNALTENGVAVIQGVVSGNMKTTLTHSSGEWISDEGIPLCGYQNAKNPMQALGSAVTYARRYGLCAMVGIAPEDDDGNALTQDKPQADPRFITEDQESELAKLITDTQSDKGAFLNYLGVTSLSELPLANFDNAKAALLKKQQKVAA
jgi:hypothetical protein